MFRKLRRRFLKKVVVCDLDDTLCNTSHRRNLIPKELESCYSDWIEFSMACQNDELIEEIAVLVRNLYRNHLIHFVSGRNQEAEEYTKIWLASYGMKYDALRLMGETDVEDLAEYKLNYVRSLKKQGLEVVLVIDDLPYVIEAMKKEGVKVLAVKPSYDYGYPRYPSE